MEWKNGRFQRRTSNLAPSGLDAVPIAKQTSGRLVTKAKKPSSLSSARSGIAHRGNNDNIAGGMEDDTDESNHTLMDDEMEVDGFGINDYSVDTNDSGDKEKAAPATPSISSNFEFKFTRNPGKNSGSAIRKKKKNKDDDATGNKEKAATAAPSDDSSFGSKTTTVSGKNSESTNRTQRKKKDDDGDEKDDKKKKDNAKVEKKKKKSKKECKKSGCTTERLKGNKFCKAHAIASKKSDDASPGGIDSLSAKSTKPAALEAENDPGKKVKAKKRRVKRKSPPEATLDVPAVGTSSANKRQRSNDDRNPSDQLEIVEDVTLPDLEDDEIGEMETDLFNLLDETIKIRYQDYVEENQINEDLFAEEQTSLEIRTEEDESPPDESSVSKQASSRNEVETRNKENMPSALLNSLTDSVSVDAGHDSEDDEQIPLFYTCEKCDRVFFAKSQVTDHENQCTREVVDGRVFTHPNEIAEYYENYHTEGEIKSDCVIFYCPPLTTPHHNSGRTISPEDFEARGGERNDLPQNLLGDFMSSKKSPKAVSATKEKKIETDFEIDPKNNKHDCEIMNAVEHLSSTIISPDSGLPSQTITTLCPDTGKGILF